MPEGVSLLVFNKSGEIIFKNDGKWLYPLLELDEHLGNVTEPAGRLFLHDKIAGLAAAALISRMGITNCHIDLVSRLALKRFEKYGVNCSYNEAVDEIDCQTERLITPDMDNDQIYRMIRKRTGRIHGVDLDIDKVSAGYNGKPVLKNINLSLSAGDHLVITGENGAGKSTLLKVITGSLKPDSGSVALNGNRPSGDEVRASMIGYVNQTTGSTTLPVTAEEVVGIGLIGQKLSATERKYRIELAMHRTGCYHLASRNIHTLSGGERQRVSLARCISQKAGLILLDEPTSFLDRQSKDELIAVLDKLTMTVMPTIIIVSHDHSWIKALGWPGKELRDGVLC